MDIAWLIPVLIVVALVVIVGVYLWATYNSLVALNVRVDEAWSDITAQLKRRAEITVCTVCAQAGENAHCTLDGADYVVLPKGEGAFSSSSGM